MSVLAAKRSYWMVLRASYHDNILNIIYTHTYKYRNTFCVIQFLKYTVKSRLSKQTVRCSKYISAIATVFVMFHAAFNYPAVYILKKK